MKNYTHLSFDCYGTLIDWETGILNFFHQIASTYRHGLTDVEVLQLYAKFEASEEHGPYKPYKEILKAVFARFAKHCGFDIASGDKYLLADSVKVWPPFPDSHNALLKLQERYKLVIISNIDDDLFAHSEALLGIKFDYVFTALQMQSYKPSLNNFHHVQKALDLTPDNWLHVAQSIYHDHIPAANVGIDSVWIKRSSIAGDQGVAPTVDYTPTKTFTTLAEFAEEYAA